MIYFVQDKSTRKRLIKIGYTQNMDSRIGGLQKGNTDAIVVLGVMDGDRKEEKRLHSQFKPFRVVGEWFSPDASLLDYIKANAQTWEKGSSKKIWISAEAFKHLNIISIISGKTHADIADDMFGKMLEQRCFELLEKKYGSAECESS